MAKQTKKEAAKKPVSLTLVECRGIADKMLPNEKDQERRDELATLIKLQCDNLLEAWPEISRILDKKDKLSVSAGFKINRSGDRPTVEQNLSCNEGHKWKAKSDVPDPNQTELPGIMPDEESEEKTSAE